MVTEERLGIHAKRLFALQEKLAVSTIKIPHSIEIYHNDMNCTIGACRIREVFSERFSPIMTINKIPPQ